MRHLTVVLTLCAILGSSSSALAVPDDLAVYLDVSHFSWQEYIGGRRLLKESGPLFGAGCAGSFIWPSGAGTALIVRGRAEIFGGDVHYDGQTIGQNPLPVQSNTTYIGAKGEAEAGLRLPVSLLSVEPFAGVGYRWWRRDIQSSLTMQNSSPLPVGGALEIWQSLYARAGIRGVCPLSRETDLFAEAGGIFPFLTRNTAKDVSIGEPTLKPRGAWSAFGEVGVTYGAFRPSLYYQGLRFDASPGIRVGRNVIFQPESAEDLFGFRLGWAFR